MRLGSMLCLLSSLPAVGFHAKPICCDYSTWGITPAELVQAAKGRATRIPPTALPPWREKALAQAAVEWNTLNFNARFLFDQQQKLVGIELALLRPELCDDLIAKLTSAYGRPEQRSPSTDLDLYKWSDKQARESVEIARRGIKLTESCALRYRPLAPAIAPDR